jgi:F-type H+-transporting ATPase subunit a
MHESELWITKLFNDYLAGVGNAFTGLVGHAAVARPWADFVVMQLLVVAILVAIFAILRPMLSADRPSSFQQVFELIYDFVNGQAEEQVGHDGHKFVPYFGTIFIFILVMNLIGLIPCFESPTMNAPVTCGCALATFFYYHLVGLQANGFGYIKHFMGPLWWLSWLMFPIEVVSHLARPLSLTVRLYANMFAGEQVTMVFLKLTLFAVPVIFMGLHMFVGLIQAYIFMLLTMVYVASAAAHEH